MRRGKRGGVYRISIHALREEGDGLTQKLRDICQISIHALREEGDPYFTSTCSGRGVFLSTPSARRATQVNGGRKQ